MAATFKGIVNVNQLPDLEFIPRVGIRQRTKQIRTYRDAVALGQQYFDNGIRASVSQVGDSPIWKVEAAIEGIEGDSNLNIQNTHELRVNIHYPDLKTNLVLQRNILATYPSSGATAAQLLAILSNYANYILNHDDPVTARSTTLADLAEAGSPFVDDGGVMATRQIDRMLVDSNFSFPQFQYAYIHTFNFGPLADLLSDYSNVGKIFTSGGVESAENTPSEHTLPDGEWLKLPPERVDSAGQNTSLKYEYWWAEEWDSDLYDDAT